MKFSTEGEMLMIGKNNIGHHVKFLLKIYNQSIISKEKKQLAHAGLEPATFALLARRSNQLS